MAPEQVTSKDVTEKADIYAFGILMFELFTGSKPFKAENVHEVFFKILNEPLDPTPLEAAHIPTSVVELVKRCTAKDAAQRPSDFGVIVAELESVIKKLDVADSSAAAANLIDKKSGIPKPVLIGGAVAAVVVLLLLVWALLPKSGGGAVEKKADVAQAVDLPARIPSSSGEMALIKEGEFLFGEANEKRSQKAFYMDKVEVSNELYKTFATQKGYA